VRIALTADADTVVLEAALAAAGFVAQIRSVEPTLEDTFAALLRQGGAAR